MKDAPIQHAAEYLLFKAFRRLALDRPLADVRRLGHRLGRLAWRLMGSKRKLALRNLARVFPQQSAAENERIAKACFELYGAQFCETIACGRLSPEEIESRFTIEGWEIVEQLKSERSGFFLTTGHFGSAEIALHPLGLRLPPFYAVGRPLDNPRIDAALRAVRERGGGRDDRQGRRLAPHAHRLPPRRPRGDHPRPARRPSAGIKVPFLGFPAWTSPVLAILSTRTGAPVLPFTCVPEGEGGYRMTFRPPIWPGGPRSRSRSRARPGATWRRSKTTSASWPEGWLWMHRRWRDT